MANKVKHVYATDLYGEINKWNNAAPSNFLNNPKEYAPFPYKEDALTVLRMDGTKLEFPSDTFDIAFSFSSIEHFGGENHEGALKSLKEIERVLKKDGIAVIATEYIINDKDHPEFFNRDTIYSDLIDKLDSLKLVEPLDLRITTKTLDTVMNYPEVIHWEMTAAAPRSCAPAAHRRGRPGWRVAASGGRDGCPRQRMCRRCQSVRAEEGFEQMALALADQAAEAEDLAVRRARCSMPSSDPAGQRIGGSATPRPWRGCFGGKESD